MSMQSLRSPEARLKIAKRSRAPQSPARLRALASLEGLLPFCSLAAVGGVTVPLELRHAGHASEQAPRSTSRPRRLCNQRVVRVGSSRRVQRVARSMIDNGWDFQGRISENATFKGLRKGGLRRVLFQPHPLESAGVHCQSLLLTVS